MREFEAEKKVFVAHFDVLGMKSLLKKSNFEAWQIICDLAEAKDTHELQITDDSRKSLNERFFSDTIIISTSNDSIGSLHTIIARSFELFRCAFRESIPLRAGIAHGSWFESNEKNLHLFTGDALLKAYDIGESQQLIGISTCDEVKNRFLAEPFVISGKDVMIDYPVPLKNGDCPYRTLLNWPAFCRQELVMLGDLTEQTLMHYFYSFRDIELSNNSARDKYRNTVKFIKYMKDTYG